MNQTDYRTVMRVEKFDVDKNIVKLHLIAWRIYPFWTPARPFLDAVDETILMQAAPDWPLRFIGYANLRAEGIYSLNIDNLKFSARYSGDVESVTRHLEEDGML